MPSPSLEEIIGQSAREALPQGPSAVAGAAALGIMGNVARSPMAQDVTETAKSAYNSIENFSNKAVARLGVTANYVAGTQEGMNENLKAMGGVGASPVSPPPVPSVTKPAANPPASVAKTAEKASAQNAPPLQLGGVDVSNRAKPFETGETGSGVMMSNETAMAGGLSDERAGYGVDFLKELHGANIDTNGELVNQQRAAERDRFNEMVRLDNLLAKARETKTEWVHNEKGGGWTEVTVPANPVEASLAKDILAQRNAYGALPQEELSEAKKSNFQRYNAELGLLGNMTKAQADAKSALAGKLMDYNMHSEKLKLDAQKFVASQGLEYDKLTSDQKDKTNKLLLDINKAQGEMDQKTWENLAVKDVNGNPDYKATLWNMYDMFKNNPAAAPVSLRPNLMKIGDSYAAWIKQWKSQFKTKQPTQEEMDAATEEFKQKVMRTI